MLSNHFQFWVTCSTMRTASMRPSHWWMFQCPGRYLRDGCKSLGDN